MPWELEWEITIWKNKHLLMVSFCINNNIQLYLFIINIEPCLMIIVFTPAVSMYERKKKVQSK